MIKGIYTTFRFRQRFKRLKNSIMHLSQLVKLKIIKLEKIFKKIHNLNYVIPKIISNAIISNSTKIGKGTIIMNRASHQDVDIGNNCIINTGAIIEHDVKIGDNSHISTEQ